jgi:transposase
VDNQPAPVPRTRFCIRCVGQTSNRKRRPNYPTEFKHRLAKVACEPGVTVSKLAQQNWINANMLFIWRRDLHAGLLTESKSQSAHLLPVVVQRTEALHAHPSVTSSASLIEIVIADAVVHVGAGTDAALLQLVLHSLRS